MWQCVIVVLSLHWIIAQLWDSREVFDPFVQAKLRIGTSSWT